jgi:3-methylcrotonyl-CoA carboxylase alpha subunit
MLLHYRLEAQARAVRIEPQDSGYRVLLDGRALEVVVRRSDGARLDLIVDGRSLEAIVVFQGDRRIVKVGEADPVSVRRSETTRQEAGPIAAEGRLVAAMDGKVVSVMTRQGEPVQAGAALLVLEAMKMEMRIVAPFRGRVKTLACAPGDIVQRGRLLVELEPDSLGEQGSV